jgi:hypothetical protein
VLVPIGVFVQDLRKPSIRLISDLEMSQSDVPPPGSRDVLMAEAEDEWRPDFITYILEKRVPEFVIGTELYRKSASNVVVGDSPGGPLKNRGESCFKPAKNKSKTHLLSKHAYRARPTPRWPLWPTTAAPQGAPLRAGSASLEGSRPHRAGSASPEGSRPPRVGSASLEGSLPFERVPPRSRVHAPSSGLCPARGPLTSAPLPHAYGHLMP